MLDVMLDLSKVLVPGHRLSLHGPITHPGGKDGWYCVTCECGYYSPHGPRKDNRLMWVAARQHVAAKAGRA